MHISRKVYSYSSLYMYLQSILIHVYADFSNLVMYKCNFVHNLFIFWYNLFSGHATSEDMENHFTTSVLESGLNIQNMVQISMDGPNVNWKFFDNIRQKILDDYNSQLLNIGSCGLHVVHNSFKTGAEKTEWGLSSLLSSLYYLFKDSPARREDFTTLTVKGSSTLFPLKFVSHRWLENVPVCERALEIMDQVVKYVKAVENKKLPKPVCKSFLIVKEGVADKCLVPKLLFFKSVALVLEPFLKKFQTNRPVVCFLHSELSIMVRSLMRRVIKPEILAGKTDEQLSKIDVEEKEIQLDYSKIDVGFSCEKALRNSKIVDRALLEFRMSCKSFIVAVLKKVLHKCPLNYSLVKHLTCLNPNKMVSHKEECLGKFKKLLTLLHNASKFTEGECEQIQQEYLLFLDNIPKFGVAKFTGFNPDHDSSDDFFCEILSGDRSYVLLTKLMKLVMCLSHGQASVERGFSINKKIEVENMKEKTLIAQRTICDYVTKAGGILNVGMTKELLLSVRMARQKYERYLEDEREKNKTIEQKNKRKHAIDIIDELKKKKKRLETDVESLNTTADKLYQKAEATGKIEFVTQANSLKRTVTEKNKDVEKLQHKIQSSVEELKKC